MVTNDGPHLKKISPHFIADPRPVGGSIFRIYRDIRFSKDKQPYKTHAAAQFRHEAGKDVHAPGFYLHLAVGEVFAGFGIWRPDSSSLLKIRKAIINHPDQWKKVVPTTESPFIIKDKNLTNADSRPRLSAVLENKTVQEYKDVEVVTVIFNAKNNAIATSRTFVDILPKKGEVDLVFTWPLPLETELEACTIPVDVMLLLDTSGSMNNDNDDPPQPPEYSDILPSVSVR